MHKYGLKARILFVESLLKTIYVNTYLDLPKESLRAQRKMHEDLFSQTIISDDVSKIGQTHEIEELSKDLLKVSREFFDGVERRISDVTPSQSDF